MTQNNQNRQRDREVFQKKRDTHAEPPVMMTIDEIASYYRLEKSWFYEQSRLSKKTGFPVLKAGKYLRFNRLKVEEWMEKTG